jgi:hypothetical protein
MLDASVEKGVLMSTGLARKRRRSIEATDKPPVIAPPHQGTRTIASDQSLPSRDASERLGGTTADRRLGARMARTLLPKLDGADAHQRDGTPGSRVEARSRPEDLAKSL